MHPNLLKLLLLTYLSINSALSTPVRMDNPGIYSDDPQGLETNPKRANWMTAEGANEEGEVKMVECRRGVCGTSEAAPPKREMFVSRGWGAGGMPFNVLYMNSKSSKLGSGVAQPRAAAILAEPLRSPSSPDINDEYPIETPFNGDPEPRTRNSPRYTGRSKNKSQSPSGPSFRKHYSIIPQLFVSYGWGPIGK